MLFAGPIPVNPLIPIPIGVIIRIADPGMLNQALTIIP